MCTRASVCVLVEDGLDSVAILLGSFVPRNHRVCSDPDSIPFIKWEVMTPALEMRRNCVLACGISQMLEKRDGEC